MLEASIPFCDVVRPKFKEFNDFRNFVETLDQKYKHKTGMVKVIIFFIFFLLENFFLLNSNLCTGCPSKVVGSKNAKLSKEVGKFGCIQSHIAKRLWKGRYLRVSTHPKKIPYS